MLEKIVIKNINSISECVIDFEKGSYKFLDKNIKGELVNPIALYGHNGSGKTSFFKSVDFLITLMNESPQQLFPFVVNNFECDKFLAKYPAPITSATKIDEKDNYLITGSITLFFSNSTDKYEYHIATHLFYGITDEYLKKNDEYVLSRTKSEYKYKNHSFPIPTNESKLIPTLRKLAPMEIEDKDIQYAFAFIGTFAIIASTNISTPYGFVHSERFRNINNLDLLTTKSDEVKKIIEQYKDFPVYRIVKNDTNVGVSRIPSENYFLEYTVNNEIKRLPLAFMSRGMRNQSLMLSVILTLPENSVIFIDEIEAALHPSTVNNFLDFVRSRNIQLVFSSHNTNILQRLRPDQVYFAHWDNGYSKYSRLSKIYPNIREINNIEKMYLGSVFDEAIRKDE